MKNFSEFSVVPLEEAKIFHVQQISITDILNITIEVLDYENGITTEYGDDRYIIKCRVDGVEKKFFTTAAPIKNALKQIPESGFPFTTIIKKESYGGSRGTFYFT